MYIRSKFFPSNELIRYSKKFTMVDIRKEYPGELISLSILYAISTFFSILLLRFLLSRNLSCVFLKHMLMGLSFMDLCVTFSSAFYRVFLVFSDPLSLDNSRQAEIHEILAFLWSWFQKLGIFIIFSFSLLIYIKIEFKKNLYDKLFYEISFCALICLVSFIWAFIPFYLGLYGIRNDDSLVFTDDTLYFYVNSLPLALIFVLIFLFTLRSYFVKQAFVTQTPIFKQSKDAEQLYIYILYPLIFTFTYYGPTFVRQILLYFEIDDPIFRFIKNFVLGLNGILDYLYIYYALLKREESPKNTELEAEMIDDRNNNDSDYEIDKSNID